MEMKRYHLPPAYYADHLQRDCGATGVIVKETTRRVTVDLDAVAYLDLVSDCEWFIDTAGMGGFDSPGFSPIGLRRSAEATLKALRADPFTDEELAAGKVEWARQDAERREANREAMARISAQMQADRERREAEAAAHPRLRTNYHSATRNIFGLESDEGLKVGAILVTETLAQFEVIDLGDERRGDVPATLRPREGEPFAAKIELHTITRGEN